jgi:hypothetical protein
MPPFHRWSDEMGAVAAILDRANPSGRYRVEGRTFELATREDCEGALRDAGALRPDEPLAENAEVVAATQAHWHAAGYNACEFAVFLSARRAEYGWETYVLGTSDITKADEEALAMVVRQRIEAPEVEVISVLMPQITTVRALGELVSRLGDLPDWRLRDEGVEEDEELGRVVRIGLDVDVGLGQWSELLGFGPFAPLAHTRRAPFCELAIRAKPPNRPRRDQRTFMAQIHVDIDAPMFGEWWHRTELARAEHLGPQHDARGKARVTVVIPESEWRTQRS